MSLFTILVLCSSLNGESALLRSKQQGLQDKQGYAKTYDKKRESQISANHASVSVGDTSAALLHSKQEGQQDEQGHGHDRVAFDDRLWHKLEGHAKIDDVIEMRDSRMSTKYDSISRTDSEEIPLAPLKTTREEISARVDSARKEFDGLDSTPVVVHWLLFAWEFLSLLVILILVGVCVAVLIKMFPDQVLLQQQAVKLQLLLSFALLGICPTLRASLTSARTSFYWVYVIRNIIEAWMLLLAFCGIPYMNLTFLSRCTRIRSGYSNHNPNSPREAALDAAQTAKWLALIEQTWRWMLGPLAIRPVLQLCRCVAWWTGIFGQEIPLWFKIGFCSLILLLLSAAIGIGIRGALGLHSHLAQASTVELPLARLQFIAMLLALAAGVQDLVFLCWLQEERTASIVSTWCFMVEICAAVCITAYFLLLDPLVAVAKHHDKIEKREVPLSESVGRKLLDIVSPYAFRLTACTDRPVVLPKLSTHKTKHSCWRLSEEEEQLRKEGLLVQRSIWRMVLFDLFSFKVRSRLLSIIVAAIVAVKCLWMFHAMHDIIKEMLPHSVAQALVLALCQLAMAAVLWLGNGILLIGNNVYFSRMWLIPVPPCLLWVSISEFSRFFLLTAMPGNSIFVQFNFWSLFMLGALALVGAGIATQKIAIPADSPGGSVFHRMRQQSHRYTRKLLQRHQEGGSGKLHTQVAKETFRISTNFPPVLIIGAIAALVVVMAMTLTMLVTSLRALNRGEKVQLLVQALSGEPPSIHRTLSVYDTNYNNKISPEEMGIPTLLEYVNKPQLTMALGILWQEVDLNEDHQLEEDEILKFYKRAAVMQALVGGWESDDFSAVAHKLISDQDKNGDGRLSKEELKFDEIKLMLSAMMPEVTEAVGQKLPTLWREAGAAEGKGLDSTELVVFLHSIKETSNEMREAVRGGSAALLRGGAQAALAAGKLKGIDLVSNVQVVNFMSDGQPLSDGQLHERIVEELSGALGINLSEPLEDWVKSLLQASFSIFSPTIATKVKDILNQAKPRQEAAFLTVAAPAAAPAAVDEKPAKDALLAMVSQTIPEVEDAAVRAVTFLNALMSQGSSRDSSSEAAALLMKKFDKDKNGNLDFDDLGIAQGLALLGPAVANKASELRVLVGADEGGLTTDQVSELLDRTWETILAYFGDVNRDNQKDAKDVSQVVSSAIKILFDETKLPTSQMSLASRIVHCSRSAWRRVMSRNDGRQGALTFLQLQDSPLSQVSSSDLSEISRGVGLMNLVEGYMMKALKAFLNLSFLRLKWCLYIACLFAFVFAFFVVFEVFRGHVYVFENMQRGDNTYKGSSQIQELEKRADYATFFPGVLMSTVVCGFFLVGISVFLIITVLTTPQFWTWIWGFWYWAIFLGTTAFINIVILRRVVLDWLCISDGEIVRPRLFACTWAILVIVNFALGLLGSFSRLACVLPFATLRFHTLSTSILDDRMIGFDIGYSSYLVALRENYTRGNPIRQSFIQMISPTSYRLYGPPPKEEHSVNTAKIARNRWYVATTLARNPQLQPLRGHALQAARDAA